MTIGSGTEWQTEGNPCRLIYVAGVIFKNKSQNIKVSPLSVKTLLHYQNVIFCHGKTG